MEASFFRQRDGIQEHQLLDRAVADAVDRRAGEDRVRGAGGDVLRALFHDGRRSVAQVPAVSIMSSTRMTFLPSTLPMMFITSQTLAFWRRLSTIARLHPMRAANCAHV